jgi:hypothetical protein
LKLTCLIVKDRNLLKAGMEITASIVGSFSGLLLLRKNQITAEWSQRCYEIKQREESPHRANIRKVSEATQPSTRT